jgi:alkylation response protein AidB-like acyl-CoA dehydrogenase
MSANSEELEMLRGTTRQWVADNAPVSRFRALRNAGERCDKEGLRGLHGLGWGGAVVDASAGGLGLGVAAGVILAEECGRDLVAVPVAQGLVGGAVALASLESGGALLADIAAGRETVVLALDAVAPSTLVSGMIDADGLRLTGELRFVPDTSLVQRIVLPLRMEGDIRLALIEVAALPARPRVLVDRRCYASLHFDGGVVPGATLLPGALSSAALDRVLDIVTVTMAAEMLGALQRAFEITVDYLRTREQFGKPIGSFQALQHRAAAMLCEIETLRAVVEAAALAADSGAADLGRLAALAKGLACETSRLVMAEALQFHGGIGMTDEHDIGLYFKRGRVSEFLLGDAASHRARYADLVGL